MPVLNLSELNIVLAVLGGFMTLYGVISVKIKQSWYLGEALPAMVFGIILGPVSAKFLDSERWGAAVEGQTEDIALVSHTCLSIRSAVSHSSTGTHASCHWCATCDRRLPTACQV
jgi:hypothetical protein